jgi:predicted transcriptional regulator
MAENVRFSVILPREDVRRLDRLAKEDRRSRLGLLRVIVAEYIGRQTQLHAKKGNL